MRCLVCQGDDDDPAGFMNCDSCSRSLHKDCSGLNSTELRVVDLKGKRLLKYYCEDCTNGFRQVPVLIKSIEELRAEVETLKLKLGSIAEPKPRGDSADMAINMTLNEIQDREKRACNVMLFNLKENSVAGRDTEDVRGVFSKIVADPVNIVNAVRVGKRNKNGIRALKVTLSGKDDALDIIRNRSKLSGDQKVYINADLTPLQREQFRNAEDELKRRLSNGEQNLAVKYVNGLPRVIKKKN